MLSARVEPTALERNGVERVTANIANVSMERRADLATEERAISSQRTMLQRAKAP
jgi:hypothetical protein